MLLLLASSYIQNSSTVYLGYSSYSERSRSSSYGIVNSCVLL